MDETTTLSAFTFTITATSGRVSLDTAVPAGPVDVMHALADRAGVGAGS